MEGQGRRPARTLFATLSVLVVVAAAFVLEGVVSEDKSGWPWPFKSTARAGVARVKYVEEYTRCKDVSVLVEEIPQDRVEELLASLAPGWEVISSAGPEVEIRRRTDGFCPDHLDFRFISLYKGTPGESLHVCVFRGKKADPAFLVKERRDLDEAALAPYPKDREDLRTGVLVGHEPEDTVPFDPDEKVAKYLEGLTETR